MLASTLVGGQGSERRANTHIQEKLHPPSSATTRAHLPVRLRTCRERRGFRGHGAVAAQVSCRRGDVVGATALEAVQGAAGAGGVTGDRRALACDSLDPVRAGTPGRPPRHLGSARIVVDGEVRGGTWHWREKRFTLMAAAFNEKCNANKAVLFGYTGEQTVPAVRCPAI